MSSEPYDPYIPGGAPAGSMPSQSNAKTAAIQAQIDDTVGIMRENITKVAERGERLDALQDKTGESTIYISLYYREDDAAWESERRGHAVEGERV